MDSAAREALAERILSYSTAGETEVLLASGRSELTRFTHNFAHQNVAESDVSVNVRAIVDKRTSVASTNVLDEKSLRETVERAIEMAKLAPRDAERPPLPPGGKVETPPGAYVAATAQTSPFARAQMCNEIFQAAERADLWCAGFVNTSESGVTVLNSNGARSSFDGTDAAVNVKMNAADSSGYAEGFSTDAGDLDAGAIAARACAKALDSAAPQSVDPGEWTVILEPTAFGELFMYVSDHFSAQAYNEGSSFLSDGLGRTYLGENVTVLDDYAHPLAPGMPFDFEGHPTQRLPLIEAGIARNVVTDSYWAHKLGLPNTGHALPAPNAYGPQATHMVIAPGSKPLAQLVAETRRGLLITRFWYIRTVDKKKAIVTGMTRDGMFLIQDGAVGRGVRNMRFNQSIIEALGQCEFSNSLQRTGSYSYSVVAPGAKIEGFTFSSGTSF